MVQTVTSRQQQAMRTKKRIIKHAFELLEENNIEDITIAQICEAAGVSIGSFYHYFESKQDLYISGYVNFDQYIEAEFTKEPIADNIAAITKIIEMHVAPIAMTSPHKIGQILKLQFNLKDNYVLHESRFSHLYVLKRVGMAIEKGEFHESHNAQDIALLVFRLARGWIFDWSLRGGSYDLQKQVAHDLALFLKALRQPL